MNALYRHDAPEGPDPLAACPMHRPVRSALARHALTALGFGAFGLGTLGLFVPLLPSFVFWLLAAWAWAKARPGLTARLLAHPRLGPALYAYLCHGAIARAAKRAAIGGMTLSLGLSALLLSPPPALIAVLAGGWALGCLWIATRREGPDSAAVRA